ncbi:MAG: HNH endonuclease [Ekhidna sp.]|nr:HNH endonuclease [Ekhidna sp.]MBC6410803.1 HNH endonuclease [Ekhidna sp.]MBC6427573.1 HNH endonuclease [Ekhidna sp.]
MVLVLNQDYSLLTVCTVQRAFLLIFLEKADLVESIKQKHLRSISESFPFPSVVRVKQYVNIPYNKEVVMSRHNIFKRDNGKCQYCGTSKDLTLDHVVPRSKGGKSTWTNLVTACKKCNSVKGDFTLEKAGMKLKKKPMRPSYLSLLRMSHGSYQEEWIPYLNPKKAIA